MFNYAKAQPQLSTNANINMVTANAGVVTQGNTIDLFVSVANTGVNPIQVNRVRPSISVPVALCSAAINALQTGLPPGWIITNNTGANITICNGTDVIPAGATRTITIKLVAVGVGGPSTISGGLQFGPGTGVCTGLGSLTGDNPSDNLSQTSITVVPSCPLTVSASAGVINCNGGTTTITATTSGAVGAVEYRINAGPYQSSNIFTVPSGTYTVTARQVTNVNCTALSAQIVLSQPSAVASPLTGTIVQPTCTTSTGSVVLSGLPSSNWTINPGNISGSGSTTTINNLLSGTYNFTVTNSSGCTSAPSQQVVINAQPTTPTIPTIGSIIQPTCISPSGSVVLSGLPAGNWIINPGNIAGSGTSTTIGNLSPSIINFTVTNAEGCSSAATSNVVIDAVTGIPPAPVVSIIQPTCTNPNATITVTSSTSGLLFSLDNGPFISYPLVGFSANEGNHTLRAQTAAGCTSVAANIVVNAQPSTPAAPTVNIIQPSCTLATALVTLTSPTISLTFSIDGGSFVAYPTGGFVLSAGTHTISAQNVSGCVSSNTVVTINQQPETPSAPIIGIVTQPTCIVSSGSVVLSGLPSGTWTINPGNTTGSTSSVTLSGLADGNYNFTVTNAFGCTSPAAVTVSINPVPGAPSAAVLNVSQPTCTIPNGTVTILSNTTGLLFSIDGGSYLPYPVGGYTVAPGLHTILSQNAAFCTSSAAIATVNNQPETPTAPTTLVTQPSCSVSSGIITVTSNSTNVLFSVNAGPFITYPAGGFVLTSGSYNLIAQNSAGCTSSSTAAVINPQPPTPTTPTISIQQPTCAIATGTITITSPTNGLTFSVDGGTFLPYPSTGFVLGAGAHTLSAQNSFGCISAAINFSINIQPATPAAPTVNIVQPNCTTANAVVTVTSATTGLLFSLNGSTPVTYPTSGYSLASGNYTLTVQNAVGCTSAITNINIIQQPSSPSGNLTSNVIACNGGTATLTVTATGGVAPYEYSLNAGATYQTSNIFTFPAGVYSVTIRGANGCTVLTNTMTVVAPPVITANVFQGAVIPCNGGNTTLTVLANGGTPPLQYRLNGGAYQTNNIFTVGAGIQTITVRDANLCTRVANAVTITQPLPLRVTASAPRITTCGGTTTVTISATGGTAPYTNTGNFVRKAGVYSFVVTDANGCTSAATIDIEAAGCMDLRAFPNPATSFVTIDHTIAEEGAFIQIYTIQGQKLLQRAVPIGAFTTKIDLRNFVAGSYMAVFQNSKDRKTVLFEKVN